jgi:hypothetical protein
MFPKLYHFTLGGSGLPFLSLLGQSLSLLPAMPHTGTSQLSVRFPNVDLALRKIGCLLVLWEAA